MRYDVGTNSLTKSALANEASWKLGDVFITALCQTGDLFKHLLTLDRLHSHAHAETKQAYGWHESRISTQSSLCPLTPLTL